MNSEELEREEFDNDASEETALMVDHLNEPYHEYVPNNFTDYQKKNWLQLDNAESK
jgi:hypothetical protein